MLKKHSIRYDIRDYFIKSKNVSLIITIGYLGLTLRTVTSKSKQKAISPISMPFLYSMYTADIPITEDTFFATCADDTTILTTSTDPVTASNKLQELLDTIQNWFHR